MSNFPVFPIETIVVNVTIKCEYDVCCKPHATKVKAGIDEAMEILQKVGTASVTYTEKPKVETL